MNGYKCKVKSGNSATIDSRYFPIKRYDKITSIEIGGTKSSIIIVQ